MIDYSDVSAFATKLSQAGVEVEAQEEVWAQRWGSEVVDEMVATVARNTGALASSVHQVEPGGIAIGAEHWRFVDRGTSRMAPQPFIAPSVNRVKPRSVDDARRIAVEAIIK